MGILGDFVQRASESLGAGGTMSVVVPYARESELRELCEGVGFEQIRARHVLPRIEHTPNHVLLEAMRGPAAYELVDPLVVHNDDGQYTSEVSAALAPPPA